MHWLRSIAATSPGYPAVWLVDTAQHPRNLAERSALRRGTAKAILAHRFGRPEDEIAIAHDPAGRPWLAGQAGTDLHLSLATRAGIVAVALARQPVGVDVERVESEGSIPREALHPTELVMLDRIEPSQRPLAFARLWAAKEAYVKALGTGFVRPPESFAVSLPAADRFRVDDPVSAIVAEGALATVENGGRETLAAAVIVLDAG